MTLHQLLGHPSEEITRATGLKLGLQIKGAMNHCEGCGLGKMRQKNINKEQVPRGKEVGDRMSMDISSIKYKRAGGAKYWALFMDDNSGFLINRFLKQKSDLAKEGSMLMRRPKHQHGINIKITRCDNAGENKKLEEAGIEQECESSLNTPQLVHLNRMEG